MIPRPDIAYHQARILIVDDERHNRQLLEAMLAPEGFHLVTAASGEEALAMVAQQPPDLILLDIMMPGMDGYQVAAKIKGDRATKNIPVIMVTALDDRSARMLGLSAGAEDFLIKPVDRAELCVRVRNLLRLKAYGDHYDKYSQALEGEVASRTADLVERTKQAALLTEQAALLDLAQDAIVVRDMHSRILFWNRGAEVLYGWLGKDALGQDTRELLRTEFSEPTDDIQAEVLREGQWEGEAIHHKRDGTRVIVASRWALQRDADGVPVRILTINNDITDRKQAVCDLLSLTERLEAANARLQELNRLKDEFLTIVSHDLRSPLGAIEMTADLLLQEGETLSPAARHEFSESIARNAQHLNALVLNLLDLAKIEAGRAQLELSELRASDVARDSINALEFNAHAKHITVQLLVPPDEPPLRADRLKLSQVFNNLLSNAIKFTPEHGRVTVRVQPAPGGVKVSVADTGIGIPSDDQPYVFEKFTQSRTRGTAGEAGTGIGLTIVRQLVELHGGHVDVVSEVDRGTTFTVHLPDQSGGTCRLDRIEGQDRGTEAIPAVGGSRARLVRVHAADAQAIPEALVSGTRR